MGAVVKPEREAVRGLADDEGTEAVLRTLLVQRGGFFVFGNDFEGASGARPLTNALSSRAEPP
jgi:hypothetical protein